jgi:two-component system LytT family response regulator
MELNCVVVDDDELDRLMVLSCLKNYPEIKVLGVFGSSVEALEFLEVNPVDILFLDIDMPEMSGIELRKRIPQTAICVFITSYPEHAVESFEVEALDFLVKPLKADRFKLTIARIHDYLEIRQKVALFESSLGGDTIVVKEGHTQTKIKLHSIRYLQAMKDYTLIFTTEKRHCVLGSLGTLLKEAEFQSFVRVHKSYAINPIYIERVTSNEVILKDEQGIPLGRGYKETLNLLS